MRFARGTHLHVASWRIQRDRLVDQCQRFRRVPGQCRQFSVIRYQSAAVRLESDRPRAGFERGIPLAHVHQRQGTKDPDGRLAVVELDRLARKIIHTLYGAVAIDSHIVFDLLIQNAGEPHQCRH